MKLTLSRLPYTRFGTFGVLSHDQPLCVTLEDNWHDNQVNVSCIPKGTYQCVPHSGTKFKDVWRVLNVPGRTAILIHAGNTEADTQGCILVGQGYGAKSIVRSREAMKQLKSYLPNKFTLEIKDLNETLPWWKAFF